MNNPFENSVSEIPSKSIMWDHSEIPDETRNILNNGLWTNLPETVVDKANQISAIDTDAFGSRFGFSSEQVQEYFLDPNSDIVLLYDERGPNTIIGYSISVPVNHVYPREPNYMSRECRPNTAYIVSTVIRPEYRGYGLVGKMMHTLEQVLKTKGYTHVERDSAVKGEYAANIQKTYADKIEESIEQDSPLGKQVFFRIKL